MLLLAGFLVVATAGGLAALHGRRAGAAALMVGALVVAVAGVVLGRDAVGDLMLGVLLGLPVLAGGVRSHDRRSAAPTPDHRHHASGDA
ncbi:hypothetical protein [Cellulomonas sp. SLBN-39]|uniref:hypothetical protein n=1 Tax=Cellulomonas sp. SLBN-39 TaxID=2768446 RepID=UPI00114F5E61|nr:hypothetical protein [Cellulomonas sp. SLBN-39]TQL03982.1 hypothetical protein FBY24_3092 [Cellulomonas sp. SLBN-39]